MNHKSKRFLLSDQMMVGLQVNNSSGSNDTETYKANPKETNSDPQRPDESENSSGKVKKTIE